MSEHYDFHYQPTGSGAISGQQVLEQTEDAINELGDYVNDNVGGAMDVAQQALETAQNAEQDAQTALDTANSFSSAIQSAQQDASTALSTAQTAQTTASNANNTAIQASQDASSAVTTANNASGQVNTLSGTVTALGQRVTTAEGNIGQNTSDITALGQRVTTAEGNITTLQNDVTIAQGNASSAMATAGQVKQQAYVFRYSSTVLVDSSTNSNALLDNTDNLKVGDKVIDSSGVLFSITAIDTQNSTFTIGTALIDLAQDSDVVHKSGNETVGGVKTFNDDIIRGFTTIASRTIKGSGNTPAIGSNGVGFFQNQATLTYQDSTPTKDVTVTLEVQDGNYSDGKSRAFFPNSNNTTNLGKSGKRWANVYATNYYYGGSEVEFSQKFVTTDTNQTITGNKTFEGVNINLKSITAEYGVTGGGLSAIYSDKNSVQLAQIKLGNYTSGVPYTKFSIYAYDSNNQLIDRTLTYSSSGSTLATAYFRPDNDSVVSLGTTSNKWSRVYATNYYYGSDNVEFSTKFVTTDTAQTITGSKTFSSINGVEPSSLSLPSGNVNDVIDISSYITALDGTSNSYTVPTNGWISIAVVGTAIAIVSSLWSDSRYRTGSGNVRMLYPVLKNETLNILVTGTTLAYARFIPCQGNV